MKRSPGYELGKANELVVVAGAPGTGKSTHALRVVRRELADGGRAYVVAHDPEGKLPAVYPDGTPSGVVTHWEVNPEADVKELTAAVGAALASAPGAIHAYPTDDGDVVAYACRELGSASVTLATGQRRTHTPAFVVLLDEGTFVGGISPERLDPVMRRFLARRRHYHCMPVLTTQSLAWVHYTICGMATRIVLFRQNDKESLALLRRLQVPKETVARVQSLPDYQWIEWRPGQTEAPTRQAKLPFPSKK